MQFWIGWIAGMASAFIGSAVVVLALAAVSVTRDRVRTGPATKEYEEPLDELA